jgi:hypothetical protein
MSTAQTFNAGAAPESRTRPRSVCMIQYALVTLSLS